MSAAKIDAFIKTLPAWQAKNCTAFRTAVRKAAPAVEEAWKWEVPVFQHGGRNICAMSGFAKHTKFNFFDGAALPDPAGLFNSGLDSKKSRSINLAEGESVDGAALNQLLKAAFA